MTFDQLTTMLVGQSTVPREMAGGKKEEKSQENANQLARSNLARDGNAAEKETLEALILCIFNR